MKNLFILTVGLFLLAGCSNINVEDVSNQKIIKDNFQSIIPSQSGLVIDMPIPTTGKLEIYDDNSYFVKLKNNPKCLENDTNAAGVLQTVCEGISGYNHLYKVPSLKLEYLFESDHFAHDTGGMEKFLNANDQSTPIIVSGNILYRPSDSTGFPRQYYIIMKQKDPNQNPLDVVNSEINPGCDIGSGSSPLRFSIGGDLEYTVQIYGIFDSEKTNNPENVCVIGLPVNWGNMYRNYVFSKKHKDYYYIVGTDDGWNQWMTYSPKSLKLFVE